VTKSRKCWGGFSLWSEKDGGRKGQCQVLQQLPIAHSFKKGRCYVQHERLDSYMLKERWDEHVSKKDGEAVSKAGTIGWQPGGLGRKSMKFINGDKQEPTQSLRKELDGRTGRHDIKKACRYMQPGGAGRGMGAHRAKRNDLTFVQGTTEKKREGGEKRSWGLGRTRPLCLGKSARRPERKMEKGGSSAQ